MKIKLLFFTIPFILAMTLNACSPPQEVEKSASQIEAATATAQANLSAMPPEIPIHESGYNFKFAAENTYISYEVDGAFDVIVEYYRTELERLGWEKINTDPEQVEAKRQRALTLLGTVKALWLAGIRKHPRRATRKWFDLYRIARQAHPCVMEA